MTDVNKEAMLALSVRFHDLISGIVEALDDEGDRVYLGSTNDADALRDIAAMAQDIQWTKDEPPVDWVARVQALTAVERDRLKARVAELEGVVEAATVLATRAEAVFSSEYVNTRHLEGSKEYFVRNCKALEAFRAALKNKDASDD